MKQSRFALVIISIIMAGFLLGTLGVFRAGYIPGRLEMLIFALIIIAAVYAFVIYLGRHKDARAGLPVEDELSALIKYKAGYYAFIASMYVWLFIFVFKGLFPNVESMLGGGILLSAAISMAIKYYLTRNFHADQD